MNTKISGLLSDIQRHNALYRQGNPEISDAEYDKLVDELRNLDPDNDWFKQPEPVSVKNSRKKKLPIPMKSLNKVKSIDEVLAWVKSLGLTKATKLVIMPKYDGVSWLRDETNDVTYSRGGSENEGQDCSAHFKTGNFQPLKNDEELPVTYTFGELVFSRQLWEDHFVGKKSPFTGEIYKSARNTVAGFINRDEPTEAIGSAEFVRYGTSEDDITCWSRFYNFLKDLSSYFYQHEFFKCIKVEELDEEYLWKLFTLWRNYYYIDGLVIYIDDISLWERIGRQVTSGNPLYAIAYKHPDFTETFNTTVKGIDWKVSKSGALKPVVNIDAVNTGDCVMENPTGYNAGWVVRNKIAPGAKILVTRSGGVIPKILDVMTPATEESINEQNGNLNRCPSCGQPTRWDSKLIELSCQNTACPGIRLAKMVHFFNTVGVENMGEETMLKLYNAGFDTIRKLLDAKFDEILKIEGFGEAIANDIISQMKKIKKGVDLATLIHASDCFKGIGKVKAQKILDSMSQDRLDAFCQGHYIKCEPDPNDPDFKRWPVTQQNWWLGYFPFINFIEKTGVPYLLPQKTEATNNKYAGMSVCFSGVRDAKLEREITEGGGNVVSGVSKKTTHLIVADVNGSSSKISKARQFGIPIVTISDFKA